MTEDEKSSSIEWTKNNEVRTEADLQSRAIVFWTGAEADTNFESCSLRDLSNIAELRLINVSPTLTVGRILGMEFKRRSDSSNLVDKRRKGDKKQAALDFTFAETIMRSVESKKVGINPRDRRKRACESEKPAVWSNSNDRPKQIAEWDTLEIGKASEVFKFAE
jgi:hypothetical protein